MRIRTAVAPALATAMVLGVADPAGARTAGKWGLAPVRSCAELRDHEHSQVLRHARALPVSQERRASDPPVPTPMAFTVAAESSDTNVQEAGIDEPDTVKVGGGIVFTLARGGLIAVDARGPVADELGRLALPGIRDGEMFLHGDRLLVLARPSYDSVLATDFRGPAADAPKSLLLEIAVNRPASMRVVRTLTFEGRYLSARRQGRVARVVLTTPPSPVVVPAPAEGEPYKTQGELQAIGAGTMAAAGPARLMPDALLRNAGSGTTRSVMPGCQRVRLPREFSGLDVLTVLTLDLEKGIAPVDIDAVLGSGENVYAAHDALYVATSRFEDGAAGSGRTVTRIHRFETGTETRTVYRSTGSVLGTVLNQFAFSQYAGHLRVASTSGWGPTVSESYVTVLAERGGQLVRVGRVGGLGPRERIRGVRFLGDVGYVVTFRQTDPLYTVDLSEPEHPKVRGELKIPGYSAYLHPIGDGLLLGVGRDGDSSGRLSGAQVSLFDVSDLDRPRRVGKITVDTRSESAVEWDHHAFLWWPRTRTAIVPLDSWGGGFTGFVGVEVSGRQLTESGRLAHAGSPGSQRSIVVGGRLVAITSDAVTTARMSDLTRVGSLPLAPFA